MYQNVIGCLKSLSTRPNLTDSLAYPFSQTGYAGYPTPQAILRGVFKEWPLPNDGSWPLHIVNDGKGNAWFTQYNGNRIGKLEPEADRLTEWVFGPYLTRLKELAIDTSGMVWFTALRSDAFVVGRLNPNNNSVAIWSTLQAREPAGLVVDPGGNVWYPRPAFGRVPADITMFRPQATQPEHNFFIWTIEDLKTAPGDMIADITGIYWLTLGGRDSIAKFTHLGGTAATLEEWPIATAKCNPFRLAIDSYRSIYFTEIGTNKVARLNPNQHTLTEWMLPTFESSPFDISISNTSNVPWFTEFSGNAIATLEAAGGYAATTPIYGSTRPAPGISMWLEPMRVNYQVPAQTVQLDGKLNSVERYPSLAVNEWEVPTAGSNPSGISVDSRGNVWFTESRANKIARLVVSAVEVKRPTEQIAPAVPQPTNLAIAKKVVSCGVWKGEQNVDPSKAVDGDFTSKWVSDDDSEVHGDTRHWIYIDLETSRIVIGARVVWDDAYAPNYEIQISSDASNWQTLVRRVTMGGVDTLPLPATRARYWRLFATAVRGVPDHIAVRELEIWGYQ